jgi:TetR/AcrR family transcriptional repressor of bet genes
MGRPSNTAERREEIVEALLRVMAESGYDGASVASIAEEAGLAAGLVHYHFHDKREILLALGEVLVERVWERYGTRKAEACDDWERLYAFTDAHVALGPDADPDAVACWVMFAAEALRDPEVRRFYRDATRRSLDELTDLVTPLLPKADAKRAASVAAGLLSAIEGAYHLSVSARAVPRGFAAPMLREMARGLVTGS